MANSSKKKSNTNTYIALIFGFVMVVVFGLLVFDNVGVGIAIGVAIGASLYTALGNKK